MFLNIIKKYRSILVIASSLIFNLVSSLLVYKPDGAVFNYESLTITEWICDIIGIVWFFVGLLMLMYDGNRNAKEQLKEAFDYGVEEFRKVNIGLEIKK